MANQIGERYFVEVTSDIRPGGVIFENTEVKATLNGNDVPMETLAADYFGFTPGAQHFEVTLKNIMVANPTFNFFAAKANREFVNIRVVPLSGNPPWTTSGHISSPVSVDSAEGKNTEQDLTVTGTTPSFENGGLLGALLGAI